MYVHKCVCSLVAIQSIHCVFNVSTVFILPVITVMLNTFRKRKQLKSNKWNKIINR